MMDAQWGFPSENENATYYDEEYFAVLDVYIERQFFRVIICICLYIL